MRSLLTTNRVSSYLVLGVVFYGLCAGAMAGNLTIQGSLDVRDSLSVDGVMAVGYVPNVAQLRGFVPSGDMAVIVGGYYSPGDGGGGEFYWVQSSTEPDNGGTIIKPDGVSVGRWFRTSIQSGCYNIKQFGAKGDGVTDDTDAIARTCATATALGTPDGGVVLVPPSLGSYVCGGDALSFSHKKGITVKGTGGIIKIADNWSTFMTETIYFIDDSGGTCEGITFDSLIVDGNSAHNTPAITDCACDVITATSPGAKVINCKIYNAPDSAIMFKAREGYCRGNSVTGARDAGVYVSGDGLDVHCDSQISDNALYDCLAGGITIKRQTSRLLVKGNIIRNCGNGITLEDCEIKGATPQRMLITDNIISRIGYITIPGQPVSPGRGIDVRFSDYCQVLNNKIMGAKECGVFLNGSSMCTVGGNSIYGSGGNSHGIVLEDRKVSDTSFARCAYNNIFGNTIDEVGGFGIFEKCSLRFDNIYNIINNNVVWAYNTGVVVGNGYDQSIVVGNRIHGQVDGIFVNSANNIIDHNINTKTSSYIPD